MDGGERLQELFLALFDSDAELRRFFALYGFLSPQALPPGESLRSGTLQAARTLRENGQINEALFNALEERSPGRRHDIREVARFYGAGARPPGAALNSAALPGNEVPPELADFTRQLLTDLDALQVPDDAARVVDPDHWPWTAVAAVLGSFQPTALHPLPGSDPLDSALLALADFIFPSFDGSWVLRRELRIPCLKRLRDHDEFTDALRANRDISDLHRDLIEQLAVYGWPRSLAELDTRRLEALGVVVDWLEPALGTDLPVDRAAVAAAAERRLLLDPLRALTGTHFRGRTKELGTIHDHISGGTPEPILCVQGPGGIGKSSLMGKVLLDLEDQATWGGAPVSFAYIDFDRARHDPHDPIGLLEQVARQLRLLYATAAEASQFAALESVSAGTDLDYAAEILNISRSPTVSEMISALAERLRQVRDRYSPGSVSLVVALDTFEEVQIKGPGATHNVVDLIGRLQQALPDMRVIVSGRGVIREFAHTPSARVIWLEDLDPEAADAVLEYLGVADPGLRRHIAGQFGRNPLTLHLAAQALADTGTDEEPFEAIIAQADALAKVSIELVQGILYRRILGHIADPDAVKVAYPGLAVRRVTVDVLREVLAEPCGFDPDRAEVIFEQLQKDVAMFDLEDRDTLRHRQDVRRLMLRIMRDDPRQAPVVNQIHGRAAAFYASRDGDEARAEELYHRLMGGEDPRLLDRLWQPKLNPLLASAMEEPLPPRARSWLGRRLGLVPVSPAERDEWDQEDWEGDAASRASSWLASNLPEQCLEVLSERSERLVGSRLYALEVAADTALGHLDQAAETLDRGLSSAIDAGDHQAQLELLEAAITVRARQGDGPGVIEAARSAAALADVTGEPTRALQALTGAVIALQERGLNDEVTALNAEISRRFGHFSRSDMRNQPELVRRVLHTAGAADPAVLVHAAVEVGDVGKEHDAVFYEDSFVLERLLDQTSSSARPALAELASEVGLPRDGWSTADLTSRAVRSGRTGKVIALGLDYASDDHAARELVVGNLVRPWSQERL
jgi:hypothetical protein